MSPLSAKPDRAADRLVVAITARALFDLEDSHALFNADGLAAYAQYQRTHEQDVLAPGMAFPLVRMLLALNASAPPEAPRVEVVLLSRNSSDTGLRIFNSMTKPCSSAAATRARSSKPSAPTSSSMTLGTTSKFPAATWPPATFPSASRTRTIDSSRCSHPRKL